MNVNRKELVNILSALRPGLNKKELIQQSSHFIFFKDKIAVYNDKICITHPYKSELEFSVKGEEFYQLLNGISDDELEFSIKEQKIKIKSESTKSTMALLAEDQKTVSSKIKLLEENMGKWHPLPNNFTEALALCYFSASPDLTMGVKACICIIKDMCYATDGYRACSYKMDIPIKYNFNIPAKSALELTKFPVTEYCFSGDKWLCFKTEEGVIFSCSIIEGEFPVDKCENIFSEVKNLFVVELPPEVKQLINEVLILASDDSHTGKSISITLEENMLYVKAENELGFVEKNTEIDYEEESISIFTNSNFFLQILERSCEMYIGKNTLFFAIPNFLHVMMKSNVPKKED